jgi:hypothetical protein
MQHIWSDDDKRIIAGLLRDGDSAGQIAKKFSVSRNAIIGVVHRDKRLMAIGFLNPNNVQKTLKKLAAAAAPAHRPENRFTAMVSGGIRNAALPPPQSKAAPIVSTRIQPVGIPMMGIGAGQCRWPLWKDGGEPHFVMCGAITQLDRPYCDGHRARATTPARAR